MIAIGILSTLIIITLPLSGWMVPLMFSNEDWQLIEKGKDFAFNLHQAVSTLEMQICLLEQCKTDDGVFWCSDTIVKEYLNELRLLDNELWNWRNSLNAYNEYTYLNRLLELMIEECKLPLLESMQETTILEYKEYVKHLHSRGFFIFENKKYFCE